MKKYKLRKILRSACGGIAGLSFFLALGIVGGIEQDTIALLPGFLWSMAAIGAFSLFSWLAGATGPTPERGTK